MAAASTVQGAYGYARDGTVYEPNTVLSPGFFSGARYGGAENRIHVIQRAVCKESISEIVGLARAILFNGYA